MDENRITVFLMDDHQVVRRGLRDMLEDEPDFEVVGEAANAAEALARVPALRPRVTVLDVRLPDGEGVTVCRELRSQLPELACLMLTSFADEEALFPDSAAGRGSLECEVRCDWRSPWDRSVRGCGPADDAGPPDHGRGALALAARLAGAVRLTRSPAGDHHAPGRARPLRVGSLPEGTGTDRLDHPDTPFPADRKAFPPQTLAVMIPESR